MKHRLAALVIGIAVAAGSMAAARAESPAIARPVDAFADSIAVNIHLPSKWDTAYGDCANGDNATSPCPASVARIGAALRRIGVRHVRDGLPAAYAAVRWRMLADAVPGLRFDFIVNDDRSGPLKAQLEFAAPVADLVEYVEGPNEPNNAFFKFRYNKHPFPTGAAEEMRDLRAMLPRSALARVPIANSALGGGTEADAGRLGAVREAEFATAHAYYGVKAPRKFASGLNPARSLAPGRPMLITETGNCTPAVQTEWCAVSETVQAKYVLAALADAFEIGVVRTYLYELVDEQPDPGGTNVEQHFGLFYPDWSAKPSGTALINLHAALGTGAAAGSLGYRVQGARTILLRRQDGTYLIFAWFDADLWDASRHVAIDVQPRPFTLELQVRPDSVALFDPLDGSRRTLDRSSAIKLELPDHPVVIEVKPE